MSNRFHSKFHRQNHHTYSNPLNPDAGHDPIASREQPFQGDLVLNGALSCYAPTSAVAGYFYSNNISLCAIAGRTGAHIFSRGDTGIYVYSAGTAISAYGVNQGANIYSTGIGLDVFGTNTSIKANSPYFGITSFGGTYAGSFLSTTRAITAFGTGYALDVKSSNYGVNSYGGTFGGNFYSPSRGLSAYGGGMGVDIYSPQIGLNVKALNSGLITSSPILALSSTGGGINVFDGNTGIGNKTPNEKLTVSGNLSTKGLVFIDSNDNLYAALTISQAGDGYCIRINDQAGTDLSPFAINKDGHALFGSLFAKDALTNLAAGSLGSNITISPYMITLSAQNFDSGLFIKSVSGVPFYVEDSHEDSSPFIINNDGSVGIGTKTPNEKLTVNGNFSSNGNVFFNNGNFSGDVTIYGNLSTLGTVTQTDTLMYVTSAFSITNSGTEPALTVKQTGSVDIATFFDDNVTSLIIKNGGNVGVNTSTPNEKLTVNGSISSNGGFSTNKPISATGTYTVNSTDYSIILTAATTITLPTPSQSLGRQLFFKSITTGVITSGSTNVVNISGAATNSILAAGPGKWANLHCDGVYWQIMAGN